MVKLKLKKAKENQSKYTDLRQIMNYKLPFEIIYSGVENEGYFDILYDLGIRNFLMSYHYIQNKHIKFESRFKDNKDIRLFIDSGAHTYQNDPKYQDVSTEEWENHLQKYLSWVERNKNYIFAIANFDFENMLGPEIVDQWNKKYFEPFMLRTGIPVCFVWHQNSYNNWEYYCKRYPYVGFSSVNTEGVSIDLNEYKDKLRVAEKHNSLVHGFGMTRTNMLTELPFYTSDSTTWLVGLQYGEINYWKGTKMSRLKKNDWKGKYLDDICNRYGLDKNSLLNEEVTELVKANVSAFIEAEQFIQTRLKSMMYWLKAKAIKVDLDNLPQDFYPSPEWVLGGEGYFDLKEKAKSMNINPELDKVDVYIADLTAIMNWDNPDYSKVKDFYSENDFSIIDNLHDSFINRIVDNVGEKIEDLQKFYTECLTGERDTLLQLGTNFDRIVKERDTYITEETEEKIDISVEEVRDKVHQVLKMDNSLTDGEDAPEIDELDDEIFKKANILPIRDEKGRLVKGQTTKRVSKKLYSKLYPKFACDTCFAANNCPEYKSGYVCAFNKMFTRFDTRNMNDLIDIMYGMVDHNVTRMQKAMLVETLSGTVDPNVTNFINQNVNLINTLLNLKERQNSTLLRQTRSVMSDGSVEETLQVTNPQSSGILEKLFFSDNKDKKEENDKKEDTKGEEDIIDL